MSDIKYIVDARNILLRVAKPAGNTAKELSPYYDNMHAAVLALAYGLDHSVTGMPGGAHVRAMGRIVNALRGLPGDAHVAAAIARRSTVAGRGQFDFHTKTRCVASAIMWAWKLVKDLPQPKAEDDEYAWMLDADAEHGDVAGPAYPSAPRKRKAGADDGYDSFPDEQLPAVKLARDAVKRKLLFDGADGF